MGQDRIKRRVTRIKVGTQLGLDGFDAEPGLEARQVAQGRMAIRFEDPDPRDIRFGTQRLGDQYGTLLAGAWCLTSSVVASETDALAMIDSYDWSF